MIAKQLKSPIRRIPGQPRTLFLTFDDGPDPHSTPETLDVLARHGVPATFFLVAKAAAKHSTLTKLIAEAGHALGNHSLDHSWRPFFASRNAMLAWIETSERILQDVTGQRSIAFRSPAGVHTPPLHWALDRLGLPLVHWNVRFYDAVLPWRSATALRSLARAEGGSIVLLHDRQRAANRRRFLVTLDTYLGAARAAGFSFAALPAGLATGQKRT